LTQKQKALLEELAKEEQNAEPKKHKHVF